MDFLAHIFLPLIAAYILWPERFSSPWRFSVAGFGLLSDFDKFLGIPGLLHSLVTLGPLCVLVLGIERTARDEFDISPILVFFIVSHLVLDFVDGGPVPLFYPFLETGIGLQYPIRTVFGTGPFGIAFRGPLVTLHTTQPRPGHNTYGFITGNGVASALLFAIIYAGRRKKDSS